MYEPHKHPEHHGPFDIAWLLSTLKMAFWRCRLEKRGDSAVDVVFTPASPWMGDEQRATLNMPAAIKGDKGDKGATGARGPKGDTGAQGPQGLPGNGICYSGNRSISKVTGNRAVFVGSVRGLISKASASFLLSVFVERLYMGEAVNFQSLTCVVTVTRKGATFNPLNYQCNKWVNNSISPTSSNGEPINDYWLRGIGSTFSNVSGGPYDIFLLGPEESWGLAGINIAWSVHPVMGTAETPASEIIDYAEINRTNDVFYI